MIGVPEPAAQQLAHRGPLPDAQADRWGHGCHRYDAWVVCCLSVACSAHLLPQEGCWSWAELQPLGHEICCRLRVGPHGNDCHEKSCRLHGAAAADWHQAAWTHAPGEADSHAGFYTPDGQPQRHFCSRACSYLHHQILHDAGGI